jgi:hypothetical protein
MSEYNGSPLTKEQWDDCESRCKADPLLLMVWGVFERYYRGAAKRAVETFDNYLMFIDAAVDAACGSEIPLTDDQKQEVSGFLDVGEDNPRYNRMAKATLALKEKDDKTIDRILNILKGYADHVREREAIFNSLGGDDQAEVKKESRHAVMAKLNERNLKPSVTGS